MMKSWKKILIKKLAKKKDKKKKIRIKFDGRKKPKDDEIWKNVFKWS